MLLVLGELGGLMQRLEHRFDWDQIRQITTMVEDLLTADPEFRCHVLVSPASGWKWRAPKSWVKRCDTVIFGHHLNPAFVAHHVCADPSDAMEVVKAANAKMHPMPGCGLIVAAHGAPVKVVQLQAFLTYSPAETADWRRYSSAVVENWKQFKDAVSDTTPALHPQLSPAAL
jgi:hypothetical protein